MKKLIPALFLFLFFSASLFSQVSGLEKEQWDEKPVYHKPDQRYAGEPAYVISDKRRIEFTDDSKNEVIEYYTMHKIVHINDDHGIEYFNKIYLQVSQPADLIEVKARTILPGGAVVELDKNNIKDYKDDDGTLYKIFALEGVQKGCEVEYYYTALRETSFFGKLYIQDKFPVIENHFELIAPSRLVFETKLYNCQSAAILDSLPGEKTALRLQFREIPGAEEEKYAAYQVNLGRVEYKLSYNNATHKGERLFTWNELAKKIFNIYSNYSEKEMKKAGELVSDNKWSQLSGETEKIMAVENYIKKNISFRKELDGEQANNIDVILKSRQANGIGLMRLYGAVFNKLNVVYQFVLSANRNDVVIDKVFENWDNCDHPIFYFPAEKKFLAPTQPGYRYPWIFPSWAACYGLFCKNITIGNMTSAIAEVKQIPQEEYQLSYNNLQTNITLNAGMDSLKMDLKLIFGGYAAVDFREGLAFLTPEQKTQAIKEIVKQITGSETISNSDLQNVNLEDGNGPKPFILQAQVSSGDLIEKAGNKLLLKIGMVIGPQVEMYQEKPRQLPIKIEFGHFEERKIDFTIPDGYTIRNLDELKTGQVYTEDGVQTMGFISDYELKGNRLSIHIMEDYRKTDYPVSVYPEFQKIINKSSDFNKIVLVLEKKS